MLDRDHDDPETVIQHLHALTDPSVTANYDPQVIQTRALALFGQLKAHNRAANAQTRSHKQATADARMQMDHAHLALQNLLFEKRHLEREIEKCRQFAWVSLPPAVLPFLRSILFLLGGRALGPVGRNPNLNRVDCEYATPIAPSPESVLLPLLELGAGTRFPQSISFFRRIISELMIVNPDSSIHQDVPLYSMELFTILAPDEFKTEEILNDPHQLIINRLNFEFSERQR